MKWAIKPPHIYKTENIETLHDSKKLDLKNSHVHQNAHPEICFSCLALSACLPAAVLNLSMVL